MFLIAVNHEMKERFGGIALCIYEWLQQTSSSRHVEPTRFPCGSIPAFRARPWCQVAYTYDRKRQKYSQIAQS